MPSFPLFAIVAVLIYPASCSSPGNSFDSSSSDIVTRDTTCPDPLYGHCSQAGLPSDFCCPSGNNCIPLASNSTVLCCPDGQTCQIIKPIPCDISAQDIALHPDNTLKTIAFENQLPTCAGQCCPFGYSCNSEGNCAVNANQENFIVLGGANVVTSPSTIDGIPASTSSALTSASGITSTSSTSISSSTNTESLPVTGSSRHSISISIGALAGVIVTIVFSLTLMFALSFWIFHRKSTGFRIFAKRIRRSGLSFRKAELDDSISSHVRLSEMIARELDGRSVHEAGGQDVLHELDGVQPMQSRPWI